MVLILLNVDVFQILTRVKLETVSKYLEAANRRQLSSANVAGPFFPAELGWAGAQVLFKRDQISEYRKAFRVVIDNALPLQTLVTGPGSVDLVELKRYKQNANC
jgi:hypothetical protein